MRAAAAVPGSGAEAEASALLGGDGLLVVVGVQAASTSAARTRGIARIGLASLALVTPV
jgi:hypothetical protein